MSGRDAVTAVPIPFVHDGRTYELHYAGNGQFDIFRDGGFTDQIDASEALIELAVEAINADV